MIARVLAPNKMITIELEADKIKDLFEDVAHAQEVFGSLTCGGCNGVNVKLKVTGGKNKKGVPFKNYTAVCNDCHLILVFGQKGADELWPKNKREDGGSFGWKTFDTIVAEGEARREAERTGGGDESHSHQHGPASPSTDEAERTPW